MNSIALVDLSFAFRSRWYAQARDAEVNDAAQKTLDYLASVRDSVDHVIVCMDAPPYWRSKVDANYKANRPPMSDGLKLAARWLRERVDADGYQVARVESFEADDVIATLALELDRRGHADIRIVGCDKDLAQCVTTKVRMFVPPIGDRPAQVLGPKESFEKFGVPAIAIVDWLALMGDASDNVPGCPGVGAKTAVKLLDDNGWSLDQLLVNLKTDADEGAPLQAKERAILEHEKQILMSRELVRLRTDVPLYVEALLQRKEPKPLVDTSDMDEEEAEQVGVPAPEPKDAEPEDTALVRSAPQRGEWSLTLQPHDCAGAFKLAKVLHNSRLYSKFATPDAVFAVLMRGRELGLGVTTALDNFHVIEGKPAASAHLIMALTQRHPDCEYLMLAESTSTKAVYETKHRKHPRSVTMEYTLQEAKDAGLVRPRTPWEKFPKAMLRKTCGVLLCRAVYQEATCGLYCLEEHGMESEAT